MASTSKCPFCDGTVRSDEKNCPHCGAANENYVVDTERTIFQPKTIDELKEYCAERGMPLLRMRFFVGEDFKEPRAFGIYRDGDRFVVYKNKADGTRAIRYDGPDEAYAVNELYQKLLVECHNRGIYPDGKQPPITRSGAAQTKSSPNIQRWLGLLIMVAIVLLSIGLSRICSSTKHKNDGYYQFDYIPGYVWYRYGDNWYYSTDNDSDWQSGYRPLDNESHTYTGDYDDYYVGKDYDSDWGVTDFKDSDTWDSISSSSSSDSSSSDYSSWDSGGTDWSSDW